MLLWPRLGQTPWRLVSGAASVRAGLGPLGYREEDLEHSQRLSILPLLPSAEGNREECGGACPQVGPTGEITFFISLLLVSLWPGHWYPFDCVPQ